MSEPNQKKPQSNPAVWKEIVAKYQQPSTPRAVWQIVNTLVPYGLLWYLMYRSLTISWWLIPPLAILAGAFLVRIFIIFHDCGQDRKSTRLNSSHITISYAVFCLKKKNK